MTRKERTLNELRQVKDSVYDMPRTESMTAVEQNLLDDINKDPVRHPQVDEMFSEFKNGSYQISEAKMH